MLAIFEGPVFRLENLKGTTYLHTKSVIFEFSDLVDICTYFAESSR